MAEWSVSQLEKKFVKHFETYETIEKYFAPGRVNLIGEHIDYNGGFVLPAALTIGITSLVRKNSSNIIRMRSTNLDGEIVIDLNQELIFDSKDSWGNYPKGVFAFLKRNGLTLTGCDILFSSNLPDGAGLSSSAAIEVLSCYLMMKMAGNQDMDRVSIAKLCQEVENKFIGVNCGIMDQFSVAMGLQDNAILLDCNTLRYKYVPFDLNGYKLVVMNTNKRRELADSKYNERRSECDKALEILNQQFQLKNLCKATIEQVQNSLGSEQLLFRRARHVITENERVIQSVELLENGKIIEFGKLLIASHESLRYDYEVSGNELDAMVEAALSIPGCVGARMTGAGFGGCAIALVENKSVDEFNTKVLAKYYQKTGLVGQIYTSSIGDGVRKMEDTSKIDIFQI